VLLERPEELRGVDDTGDRVAGKRDDRGVVDDAETDRMPRLQGDAVDKYLPDRIDDLREQVALANRGPPVVTTTSASRSASIAAESVLVVGDHHVAVAGLRPPLSTSRETVSPFVSITSPGPGSDCTSSSPVGITAMVERS